MSSAPLTPAASGTSTPTTASGLTAAGIKHAPDAQEPAEVEAGALDASLTTYNFTTSPRPVPQPNSAEVKAQKVCTDHMIQARWTIEQGWEAPELKPYGPLSIMPNASVLHYATECFEGLKLYRGLDGRLRLFRVDRNCERMRKSVARIALPDFPAAQLARMIETLCAVDGPRWLPDTDAGRGSFLYIRPTMIGTDAALGVQRPREALLYVILACFPDMTKNLAPAPPALSGAAAPTTNGTSSKSAAASGGLRLLASNEDTIRAWPGGFGYAKLGANYGPSLVAQGEARARGFDQVLWLFGPQGVVTEAGASNFFVVWRSATTGRLELITAPLEERIILEGITRASILELARARLASAQEELEAVDVVERSFTMDELVKAQAEGRLIEAFAAGTAFFVAPVSVIHTRGVDLDVPMSKGDTGAYAQRIKSWLTEIMYGGVKHDWGMVVEERGLKA